MTEDPCENCDFTWFVTLPWAKLAPSHLILLCGGPPKHPVTDRSEICRHQACTAAFSDSFKGSLRWPSRRSGMELKRSVEGHVEKSDNLTAFDGTLLATTIYKTPEPEPAHYRQYGLRLFVPSRRQRTASATPQTGEEIVLHFCPRFRKLSDQLCNPSCSDAPNNEEAPWTIKPYGTDFCSLEAKCVAFSDQEQKQSCTATRPKEEREEGPLQRPGWDITAARSGPSNRSCLTEPLRMQPSLSRWGLAHHNGEGQCPCSDKFGSPYRLRCHGLCRQDAE